MRKRKTLKLWQHPEHPDVFVTDDGRILLEHRTRGTVSRYIQVRLPRGDHHSRDLIVPAHRLIAEALALPRKPGQDIVRHLDDNGRNNHPRNLAWGTAQENGADNARNHPGATGRKIAP